MRALYCRGHKGHFEGGPDKIKQWDKDGKCKFTEEQAKAIALETIGSGSVIDFEAEREDGRLIYGITIRAQGDTVEVEVDGLTGDVLEIEWGDDEDDDD